MLEKAGFRLEGCQRERYFKNGQFTDNMLYGLLRDEGSDPRHATLASASIPSNGPFTGPWKPVGTNYYD